MMSSLPNRLQAGSAATTSASAASRAAATKRRERAAIAKRRTMKLIDPHRPCGHPHARPVNSLIQTRLFGHAPYQIRGHSAGNVAVFVNAVNAAQDRSAR